MLTISSDFTTPVFAWAMVESSLAVVGANLPLLRPLLHLKTYTSSYAWSLLRSMATRRSDNDSVERLGSSSEGSKSGKGEIELTERA